jgi:O-antigen/teichoic acid export membrane protein
MAGDRPMSLRRILKLLAAFFMSTGVSVATQLLVPPIFLHRYPHGVEMYGEWIALTAAVSYLDTLHGGIQTYGANQMTLHYNRNEMREFRVVQSSSLRLLLINFLLASGVGVAILYMPVGRWMGLRYIGSTAAALTLLLMIVQLMAGWVFHFVANSYQVIGELHRAAVWRNFQRLAGMLALAALLWERASFPVLALSQVIAVVLFTAIVLAEQRFRSPVLLPSIRYGNLRDLMGVLKPSAYYMLFSVGGFFCWQGPVLVIERVMGPAAVAIFALTRVIFNMSRQALSIMTYSIGQETINVIARRSWDQLRRLYDLSERVVLLMDSALSVGVLLACPLLMTVWLHRSGLYQPGICMWMAIISSVMGIKEHKYIFQRQSNRHEGVATVSFAAYAGMILVGTIGLKVRGVEGLLVCWFVAELLITAYVIAQNRRLFPAEFRPSLAPLPRAAALLIAAFGAAAWPTWHDGNWPLHQVAALAAAGALGLLAISYVVFGVGEVQSVFQNRLRRMFAVRHS